jgi:Putative zinc-finger
MAVTRAVASAVERGGHVRLLLGAYVLGGLSEQEASMVRAHLGRCVRCRAVHDELALVPGWLDLLSELDPGARSGTPASNGEQNGDVPKAHH